MTFRRPSGPHFAKKDIPISRSGIDQWRGSAKHEIVQHFVTERLKLPDAERDRRVEAIYADFQKRIIGSYRTIKGIPGAEDALRAMRNMGVALATSAGFDAAITASIMSRLGWGRYLKKEMSRKRGGRRDSGKR